MWGTSLGPTGSIWGGSGGQGQHGAGLSVITDLASVLSCSFNHLFIQKGWSGPSEPGPVWMCAGDGARERPHPWLQGAPKTVEKRRLPPETIDLHPELWKGRRQETEASQR